MEEIGTNPFSGIFSPQPWDSQGDPSSGRALHLPQSQMPGVPNDLASDQPSSADTAATTPISVQNRARNVALQPTLGFLPHTEWEEGVPCENDPIRYLQYSIEWSATSNGKVFVKDTEPDLVLSPADYWKQCLQHRVEKVVGEELGPATICEVHHIDATVSVGRAARKLVKRFDHRIDWDVIENQLTQWANLLQAGKKLRVDIIFHYVPSQQSSVGSSQRGKKKTSSATQRMRLRRVNQLNAQQESTGEADTYTDVYRVMRCPTACAKGPHCLVDSVSKRHYKMFTYHLEDLVERKLNGLTLNSQDDVPDDFRRQVFAEERQRSEPRPAKSAQSTTGMTPITINNHFPDHTQYAIPRPTTGHGDEPSSIRDVGTLEIPSPIDLRVREYCTWQKARVEDASYKEDVDKACAATLAECRDLQQLHDEQDVTFLVKRGVRLGTAKRFVRDIPKWAKRRRCEHDVLDD